jgi:hypothetical protein
MFNRIFEAVVIIGVSIILMFIAFTIFGFLEAIFPIVAMLFGAFIVVAIAIAVYPYVVLQIKIALVWLHFIGVVVYNIAITLGIFYILYLLNQEVEKLFKPWLNISWFNHNGMDNGIDLLIILLPSMLLFMNYVLIPIIRVLLLKLPYGEDTDV